LPKIAILLGAFERIARGEMILDNGIHEKLTQMIRNSSNRAATEVLNRIGKSYLADLLQSAQYRFYDPALNGGLWVGKEYGTAAAWERDPLHNLSHGATAFQVARFYYLLETGKLISPKASKQMKEILGNPAIHHKFVRGLERARPDSRIYRKSGTWGRYHSDSAIVEHGKNRYIAVALAKSPRGEEWLSSLIVELDDLICRSEKAPTQISSRYDKTFHHLITISEYLTFQHRAHIHEIAPFSMLPLATPFKERIGFHGLCCSILTEPANPFERPPGDLAIPSTLTTTGLRPYEIFVLFRNRV
jgi:hypothetical protein